MGGQVLGGGVVVLVAVLLWLLYLLPSWQGRHRYYAAERNAVRLNQALRVLAATSETPEEVRLELNARTALAQQKLAKQVQSEQHDAELERMRAEAAVARQVALVAKERARAEAAAAAAAPAVRRARARRRARVAATTVGVVAVGGVVGGGMQAAGSGSFVLLWSALAVTALCALMLQRMAAVQRRAHNRVAAAVAVELTVERVAGEVQDVSLVPERAAWTPRELPRPLTVSAGSRAAAVLDGADAHAAARRAAVDEAMREQAARHAPVSIDQARRAGTLDDATIEAHVRQLLERRAVGA